MDALKKRTYFFGKENPLSNWHAARFVVKGIEFEHVEQFMMFCKAMLFGDKQTAAKILEAKDPKDAKRLGREVKGFVESVWLEKREVYVARGCFAKFSQNPEKGDALLATMGTELVEASPYDKIWGAGLGEHDPRIVDKGNWPGLNLLGQVLERVRDKLFEVRMAASASDQVASFHEDGSQPRSGEVFVFGSNLAGRHGKGSALAAREKFGAVYGKGEGRWGQSYAIATKDGRPGTPDLRDAKATLSLERIKQGVEGFLEYARQHPEEKFFVVRLGCDLAAWKNEDIAPMFKSAPSNCSFPEPWREFISPSKGVAPRESSQGKRAEP